MCAAFCVAASVPAAVAQKVDPWTALQQTQADLKADRQAVVAADLPRSPKVNQKVRPAYKELRGEMEKAGDRTAKLISVYAANYQSMDDAKAEAFFKEWISIERERVAAREKHIPKIRAICRLRRRRGNTRSEQARRDCERGAGVRDSPRAAEEVARSHGS